MMVVSTGICSLVLDLEVFSSRRALETTLRNLLTTVCFCSCIDNEATVFHPKRVCNTSFVIMTCSNTLLAGCVWKCDRTLKKFILVLPAS